MAFIVIEGVDGAGKATQMTLLKDKYKTFGKVITDISYPKHEHRSATFIDQFLSGTFGGVDDVDPYVSSSFYTLDRFVHKADLQHKIDTYDHVISNRYSISNFIHRGAKFMAANETTAMNEFFVWLRDFEFEHCGLPYPDRIIYLSVGIDNIMKNLEKKAQSRRTGKKKKKDLDIAEKDKQHQQYALLVGKEILPDFLDNYVVIECENEHGKLLSPEAIHEKILPYVLFEE